MAITVQEVWQAITDQVLRAEKAEVEVRRLTEENGKLKTTVETLMRQIEQKEPPGGGL